jgi:hypothetical protein
MASRFYRAEMKGPFVKSNYALEKHYSMQAGGQEKE